MLSNYKYPIQQCDTIRYLLLHRYGGWYADMDYYCCKPLDEVANKYPNDIYLVQTPNTIGTDIDHVSNSLMFSKANHSFWKQLMVELEKNPTVPYYYTKHLVVMFTTGPVIVNRVYSKYKYRFRVKSLPYKLFHPYGISDTIMSLKNNSDIYTIHIGKGSWESDDSKFFLGLLREWKIMVFVIILLVLPLVIYNLTYK